MLHLAAEGWVCVAANYRLSPRAVFPDHLVDCKQALAWIREHIAEYGGDPDLICVTGGSAGGHLAAMAALTANEPQYQPGFESADTSVAACVPFYGVYDFTALFEGPGLEQTVPRLLARWVMKMTPDQNRACFWTPPRSTTSVPTRHRSSSFTARTTTSLPSAKLGRSPNSSLRFHREPVLYASRYPAPRMRSTSFPHPHRDAIGKSTGSSPGSSTASPETPDRAPEDVGLPPRALEPVPLRRAPRPRPPAGANPASGRSSELGDLRIGRSSELSRADPAHHPDPELGSTGPDQGAVGRTSNPCEGDERDVVVDPPAGEVKSQAWSRSAFSAGRPRPRARGTPVPIRRMGCHSGHRAWGRRDEGCGRTARSTAMR